ncbi:MAG: murein tripeptide amidase MpaA [Fimbriimonadaceae bacterium]
MGVLPAMSLAMYSESTIGYSVKGEPILCYSVGVGMDAVLVIGGTHGDEIEGVWLVEKFLADARAKDWDLTEQTIYIIPRHNPDGIAARTRHNANGVDLNRNFTEGWEPTPSAQRYHPGPNALSEPETRALVNFIAIHPEIKRVLTIHTPFDFIDYDGDEAKRLAELMSAKNGMPVKRIEYATPGSFGHFCRARNLPLVTVELPKGGTPDSLWAKHRDALWAFVKGS